MTLVVDAAHTGTPEARWLAPGILDVLPRWNPPVGGRVLVVAPHPDDELLGAGGLLRSLVDAGSTVDLLAVTDGEASHPPHPDRGPATLAAIRVAESGEGLRRLGVAPSSTLRLGMPDGGVTDVEDDLAGAIADAVDGPGTLVLAPWAHDGHRDHDATGRAARRACDGGRGRLVEYLVWAWHVSDPASGRIPLGRAVRVDLGRRGAAAKRWASGAHRSQIRPFEGRTVLPDAVLRRAWRPFEVFLPAAGALDD